MIVWQFNQQNLQFVVESVSPAMFSFTFSKYVNCRFFKNQSSPLCLPNRHYLHFKVVKNGSSIERGLDKYDCV